MQWEIMQRKRCQKVLWLNVLKVEAYQHSPSIISERRVLLCSTLPYSRCDFPHWGVAAKWRSRSKREEESQLKWRWGTRPVACSREKVVFTEPCGGNKRCWWSLGTGMVLLAMLVSVWGACGSYMQDFLTIITTPSFGTCPCPAILSMGHSKNNSVEIVVECLMILKMWT